MFEKIIRHIIVNLEGGFRLVNVPGDAGGSTYAGISRRYNPSWAGWTYVDKKETPPEKLVLDFYKANFWDKLRGDELNSEPKMKAMMSFAVTSGPRDARVAAQRAAGVVADGVFGPITMAALQHVDTELFLAKFALAQLYHYAHVVSKNHAQAKFIGGWANRAIKGAL